MSDFVPNIKGTLSTYLSRTNEDLLKLIPNAKEASRIAKVEARKHEEYIKSLEVNIKGDNLKNKELNRLQDELKVLLDMIEEKEEKQHVPVEDVESLIEVITVQRNKAHTRLAVEQARNRSLLKTVENLTNKLKNVNIELEQLKGINDDKE